MRTLKEGHCTHCGRPASDARVEIDGTVTFLCGVHAPRPHQHRIPSRDAAKLAVEARRFRVKSAEVRRAAEAMHDPRARLSLLSLARDYDLLAERADRVVAQFKRRAG